MYGILKIGPLNRYTFCEKYFFPISIFIDIKFKKIFKNTFFRFDLENQIYGYFHHHIRNKCLKTRKYGEFNGNR